MPTARVARRAEVNIILRVIRFGFPHAAEFVPCSKIKLSFDSSATLKISKDTS